MIQMIENERCCQKCRFYNEKMGDCRRFPPQVWELEETGGSNFPRVSKEDWCGEFQEIEKWVIPEGFVLFDPHAKKEEDDAVSDS